MPSESISFVGATGVALAATVRRPTGDARGAVLMTHCFTCSKELHTNTRLADALAEAGWLVFSFDFTGLGGSDGDFAESSVSTNVGDVRRAAMAMLQRDMGPCLLLGHSLGGSAAVLAAGSLHTVDAVICIASPADVAHVRRLLPDPLPDQTRQRFPICVGGRPFELDPQFLADLERHDVLAAAGALARPLLVVEAGADEIVGPEQTRALAQAGQGELAVVEGADHLFSSPSDARRLAEIVVNWASRHATG